MRSKDRQNWQDSMRWQIDFYLRTGRARRKDPEFEWQSYESSRSGRFPEGRRHVRRLLHRLGLRPTPPMDAAWFDANAPLLWDTRGMFGDELSKLLFDSSIVVRLTNHRRYYFPRIDFDDLLEVRAEQPFVEPGLPHDYLGMPLGVFDVQLAGREELPALKVITRRIQLQLVNSYRQYLVRRDGADLSPVAGDVVFDCGSCIGEISMLFARLAAPTGQVHLFDPIALHTTFCQLQASLNPAYASMLHINTLAVSDQTHTVAKPQGDLNRITPGAVSASDFSSTTLDHYATAQVERVDFIKMDIEGAELAALRGASGVIQQFKPRLAISGYHKPEDLWEIPNKILDLNPGYKLAFGHHTPIVWESVFYAA
jgi:FkbM family methyltransferase